MYIMKHIIDYTKGKAGIKALDAYLEMMTPAERKKLKINDSVLNKPEFPEWFDRQLKYADMTGTKQQVLKMMKSEISEGIPDLSATKRVLITKDGHMYYCSVHGVIHQVLILYGMLLGTIPMKEEIMVIDFDNAYDNTQAWWKNGNSIQYFLAIEVNKKYIMLSEGYSTSAEEYIRNNVTKNKKYIEAIESLGYYIGQL